MVAWVEAAVFYYAGDRSLDPHSSSAPPTIGSGRICGGAGAAAAFEI